RRLTSASPAILLSSELQTPATFGLLSPAVLLPERFFQLASSQQKAIICHELLHVARRDWAWNMVEELVLALFWFHPALWWAVRNIRLSREQTVDAEVVRRTQSRQAYLSALLEMAQRDLCCGSVPAPLFLREGQLSERVSLMVKEVSMSRFRLVATCFAAAAALMLTGAAAVWAFPLRIPTGAPDKVAIQSRIPGGIEAGVEDRPSLHLRAVIQNGAAPHRVDVKQLRVVRSVMPHYPAEAKKAGIQGTVRLEVLISKKGDVTEVRLISGPSALVKSAENAVKQWRYAPSPLLPARTRIEIHYTLADLPAHQSSVGSSSTGAKNYKFRTTAYMGRADGRPPKLVHAPDPPYTPEAHKAKLSGDVVLSVVVSDKGSLMSAKEVSKPLGKGLDESALKTVRTWKFTPGELDGKPVPVRMLIEVTFHNDAGKTPAASM
ncbi:MAG: TonB family protein, partial [Terriglobia bacterium]